MSVYKRGSIGEQVKQIQKALGIKVDGIFGKGTEDAVKKFQGENCLTADGKVGPKTMKILMEKMDTDLSVIIKPKESLDIKDYYLPKREYINGGEAWIYQESLFNIR